MAELKTTSGDVLYLDDEDVPLFEGKRLYTLRTGKQVYAYFPQKGPDGKQKSVLAHRLIIGAPPDLMVDHKDGNGMNCRRQNLRFATNAQNQANRRTGTGTTTEFKGVFGMDGPRGYRWRAQIHIDGEHRLLGVFRDELDAARAYDLAACTAWGEYARLNLPAEPLVTEAYLASKRLTVVHGASKFRGVSWDKKHKKWLVRVWVSGRTTCPGRFADETDAAYVHDAAVLDAGADPKRLNFPGISPDQVRERAESALRAARSAACGASSYRGVSWWTQGNCWRASITVNRKLTFMGNFSTQEEAARAYDRAAVAALGLRARTNFPISEYLAS